ncbi:hypothetical protein H310_14520 [Aphanomyces invadans]|uniref:Reverse transcriptase RNase H-like domain-containing protein n=1 Tax=Aphanomyces invadans TaxID=157072 RepID=A0A024TAT7_9STRA|nr:hypothetical protein H310_14520 [Aphanomyces invadans]ETV90731.1 hypothetical protein H310_14520 [Aphanomyces invadans]|eukprot:XP_008880621.1 hypothetical protein H310_14520 [Aphanomyces invadans]
MRQLDRPIELGEFIEAMKLTVDHDVKLRLTRLGEVVVSRDVKARLGYCFHLLLARAQSVFDLNQLGGKETPLIAATKVVKTMDKTKSSPDEALLYPEEERACFPDVSDCKDIDCGDEYATHLLELLMRYKVVFRLTLGRDPPVDVAQLVVTLKQDAEPFALDKTSQEMFSFLTDTGVYALTRVLMSGTDSVAYCQSSLNPKKCRLYETETHWCGRIVSFDGVKHNRERINALQELKRPNVDKVLLAKVGWNADHAACLRQCKEALSQDRLICVFADASDLHWGGVVTQIPRDQVDRKLDSQDHEPLMFLSGTLSGAAQRWAIVEKEAFSIVECLKRADYVLRKPGGFALFTDQANLKFIFHPASVNVAIPKYTAAKLDRWALLFMGYD